MMERPFFFPCDGLNLFGVMHSPTGTTTTPFVFCAPFGEEKLWTHRVFVSFARELAALGHPVLRFDYRGTGDSDGVFELGSPESYLADLRCAVAYLRQQTGGERDVGLLGLGLGATLAALAAEELSEVKQLVLWEPIVRGEAYMQELLRTNLAAQMAQYREVRLGRDELVKAMREGCPVNVDGYDLTGDMYDQMEAIDLLAGSKRDVVRCLVVQIGKSPKATLRRDLTTLCGLYGDGQCLMVVEEPFWKEIRPLYARANRLFDSTLRWLHVGDDDL